MWSASSISVLWATTSKRTLLLISNIGFLNHASIPSAGGSPGNGQAASFYALITVALLSGTSERFLPSLIAKFDDSTKETTAAQTTKTETPKPTPTTQATSRNRSLLTLPYA